MANDKDGGPAMSAIPDDPMLRAQLETMGQPVECGGCAPPVYVEKMMTGIPEELMREAREIAHGIFRQGAAIRSEYAVLAVARALQARDERAAADTTAIRVHLVRGGKYPPEHEDDVAEITFTSRREFDAFATEVRKRPEWHMTDVLEYEASTAAVATAILTYSETKEPHHGTNA